MRDRKEVTYKEVEDMLYNLNGLKAEIRDIEIEIEITANDFMGITGVGSNERPSTPTNAFNSNVENEVTAREKRIEHLKMLKRGKELQVERTESMLTTLSEDEKQILEYLYFKKYGIEKTGALLDVSYQTVRSKRRLSVSSLAKRLNAKNK